ncbi:unnamed protein product [Rotaria magnacalcarata]|uniref:L-Fucosyltransferase n=1 Tax=Rotaria magnacalcarata TaxID=392030 RepID=A0A816X9X6_9BILA|nr:unnamed protein product [Rotaria magnacalcarata]CAF4140646.1 unnamed protein product [Rotaria magnacalcarata]
MEEKSILLSTTESISNNRINSIESDVNESRRLRSWQPLIKRSAMIIGISLILIAFLHFSYVFRPFNAIVLPLEKTSLHPTRNRNVSTTIISLPNSTSRLDGARHESQPRVSCVFGIRYSDGAFGNRMFLFASAYGLARLHACHLYVHPWIIVDLRTTFTINLNQTPVNILNNLAEFENRTDIFRRYSACTLFSDLFKIPLPKNYTRYELVGFYQAFGYFDRFRKEIDQLFEFNSETIRLITPFVEQMIKSVWNYSVNFYANNSRVTHDTLKSFLQHPPSTLQRVTWIGVHIRRGDFLTFFKIDTSTSYLNWAINYYRQRYVNCRFLIASDDKSYAKQHLGNFSDVFITPSIFFHGHDLAALALAEHSILTAGTYSWWTAWLAGGNVVHDLNYPVPFQNCIKEHYFPPWFLFPHNSSSKRWAPPPS